MDFLECFRTNFRVVQRKTTSASFHFILNSQFDVSYIVKLKECHLIDHAFLTVVSIRSM
jgi:hypothetical protein